MTAAMNNRVQALSLEDVDALTAKHHAVEARLASIEASKAAAVESESWESDLGALEADEAKLRAEAEELARAKALALKNIRKKAREHAAEELLDADRNFGEACASWSDRVSEILAMPVEPGPPRRALTLDEAVRRVECILQDAFSLAAREGYAAVRLLAPPPTAKVQDADRSFQRSKQAPEMGSSVARVDYVVDLGFVCVPVGARLTREDCAGFFVHHEHIAGYVAGVDLRAFTEMCDRFDGEEAHAGRYLIAALQSDVARAKLRHGLRVRGYVSRAHCTLERTVHYLHQRNHERALSKPDPGDPQKRPPRMLPFGSSEFPRVAPRPGEPWLEVASGGPAAEGLRAELSGVEEAFECSPREKEDELAWVGLLRKMVEAAGRNSAEAFPTEIVGMKEIKRDPETILAAGRVHLRSLCAREEAFLREAAKPDAQQ